MGDIFDTILIFAMNTVDFIAQGFVLNEAVAAVVILVMAAFYFHLI